jgi:hypothetical protein
MWGWAVAWRRDVLGRSIQTKERRRERGLLSYDLLCWDVTHEVVFGSSLRAISKRKGRNTPSAPRVEVYGCGAHEVVQELYPKTTARRDVNPMIEVFSGGDDFIFMRRHQHESER